MKSILDDPEIQTMLDDVGKMRDFLRYVDQHPGLLDIPSVNNAVKNYKEDYLGISKQLIGKVMDLLGMEKPWMNKINLKKLKDYIEREESFNGVVATMEYDEEHDEVYLSLGCLSGVSDDYEEFAEVYEDGLFAMVYGAVNIIETFDDMEHYEEVDPYEEYLDIMVSALEQDIDDKISFLDDVKMAMGIEME